MQGVITQVCLSAQTGDGQKVRKELSSCAPEILRETSSRVVKID